MEISWKPHEILGLPMDGDIEPQISIFISSCIPKYCYSAYPGPMGNPAYR